MVADGLEDESGVSQVSMSLCDHSLVEGREEHELNLPRIEWTTLDEFGVRGLERDERILRRLPSSWLR